MSLPKIELPQPIEIPAQPAQTYDSYFVVNFALHTPTDHEKAVAGQSLEIVLRPWDYENKQLYPTSHRDLYQLVPLWSEVDRSDLFAQAMGVLVTCCKLLVAERELLRAHSGAIATRDQKGADAVAAQLAAVWDEMQVPSEKRTELPKVEELSKEHSA